ncbi:MAG: cupin domain-containing protein [Gammaproteobacteria bacterium]|nr:cupin domain-containing protein [Gammaproteobacteria bacterium]
MNPTKSPAGYIATKHEWAQRLAATPKPDWLVAFDNTDCLVEYWAPRDPDTQEPHDRDEVYVIIAGDADFDMNGQRRAVVDGDLIFVPAGMPHRFVRFSADLAMWVVFFGPVRK